jgi:hypothetical protein
MVTASPKKRKTEIGILESGNSQAIAILAINRGLMARLEAALRPEICWFLEKMDRSAYGNQTAVVGAQQNNFYASSNGKYSPPDEIAQFITEQRRRMALVRSLRLSDPEKAAAIEAETLDIDAEILD